MTAKKSKTSPDGRRKYDDAFKAEVLHLATESRSTHAPAQQLGIFKKSLGHLRLADPLNTYQHIAQHRAHVPVRQLC